MAIRAIFSDHPNPPSKNRELVPFARSISPTREASDLIVCPKSRCQDLIQVSDLRSKPSAILSGVAIVSLSPKSFSKFLAIGPRACPRSLSIQIKSSPSVQANSFIWISARVDRTESSLFIGESEQTRKLNCGRSGGTVDSERGWHRGWPCHQVVPSV